ncbi:penicillin acylase family protein [Terriglobus sp. 2YAB30_2]|uniref:penicillin acylase family protein n=1 Tax=unclassified Terriglobus TaxID=2628988 RepID=UPI003F99DDB8
MEVTDLQAVATSPERTRRILKFVGISAGVVLVLVLIAGVSLRLWLSHALNASLPQVDGTVHTRGLTASVKVERTAEGMPAIHAGNLHDLAFAQGYVTAQDRLWQMDMLRRYAEGRLSEILGSMTLEHDRTQRYLQLGAAADAALPHVAPDQMQLLNAYADGVNAFIAESEGHLPLEFRLLHYSPAKWTPHDSLLVGLSMSQELSTSFPTKLARETLTARLSPELLADLYPVGSWRDHPPVDGHPSLSAPNQDPPDAPLDETQTKLTLPASSIEELQHVLHPFTCEGCVSGSNNWAVSGAHTATGKPLLSNDMHLGLDIPGIWYESSLESPELHATGVALPGVPFIIVGHNQHIAWGFTASLADVQDLYIEKLRASAANPKQREFQTHDGNWLPVAIRQEVIHVRGGKDVPLEISLTTHGGHPTPIISPMIPREQRSLALAWTVYDPEVTASLPFQAVNQASNYEQFVTAFRTFGGPSLSAVYADDQGHIGYHAIGKVPVRGDAQHPSGLSPVPVTDGSYEWSGYISYDLMPQALDPESGVLATANARITADDAPYTLALDWENPYRNERIWKQLLPSKGLTAADMIKLQLDVYSDGDRVIAQKLAYAIDHSKTKDKRLHQAADLLRVWNGNMETSSPAAAIVSATRTALWPMLLRPLLGNDWRLYRWNSRSFVQEELISHAPARWLPSQYSDWNDLLTAAVQEGLRDANAPRDLSHWSYGAMHRIDLQHPLYGTNRIFRRIFPAAAGPGNFPLPGDTITVRAGSATFGSSERFTADLADWENSNLNVPVGQSGNPRSANFRDQWTNWYDGKPLPLPWNTVKAQHTLTLEP